MFILNMSPQALIAHKKAIYNKGKPFTPLASLALKTNEKDLIEFFNPDWFKTKISTGIKVKSNKEVAINDSTQTIPLQSEQKAVLSHNLNIREIYRFPTE